jgi:uncharacterized protein (DUF4415 family)
MKGKITRTTSSARTKGKTDFKRLRQMRDAEIDDSDIPKLDKSFWKNARLTMPEPKDRLTIRVDHDVVEWLKRAGSGYQTRINAILRSYMKARSEYRRASPRPYFAVGQKPRPLAKNARRAGHPRFVCGESMGQPATAAPEIVCYWSGCRLGYLR